MRVPIMEEILQVEAEEITLEDLEIQVQGEMLMEAQEHKDK